MKYIDADRLRAEIERRLSLLEGGTSHPEVVKRVEGVIKGYNSILSLITSLQHEQPQGLHFTPLNRLIQKIPSENWNDTVNNYAKKLCDCLINEGFRKDAEVLQGYISYMNGNNVPMATMDDQYHHEVDVVSAAKNFLDALSKTPYNNRPITDAQIIVKQLLIFFENPSKYNPDAILEQPEVDLEKEEHVGVAESPLKTFQRVNEFEDGASYRH